MKKFVLVCLCLTFGAGAATAVTPAEQLRKATNVMNEIMKTPDEGIPSDLLGKAVCVGIVPSELKFAIGVGGNYGRGVLVCRRHGDGPWGDPRCSLWVAGALDSSSEDKRLTWCSS